MATQTWETKASRMIYRRFEAGESLMEGLESLALKEGIREAAVTSCIGSFKQLKLPMQDGTGLRPDGGGRPVR